MLVCPAVFKTVAGGEELPRWVRFPHTLANGNRSGSAAPVFVHFNPSVSYAASSPAGEPFGIVQALPKSCPRLRGKCRGASRDERGNGSEMPSAVFYHLTNSYIKPALKGEVDASETSRRRGSIEVALVYANPSVSPPCGVLPAPRPGSILGTVPPECARPISRELSLICLN